ncbi:MAG: serine hydrolase domain-containing protein, partial [Actinomycetota bacterium]|nr:serine hydrolase domain-containing protein [Actinomycetota bacterium]
MAPTISGDADERFEPVRSALATNFDEDAELGASAAVVHRGRLVCDVWGGSASVDGSRPWESDTIVNLWSTTKTVAALVVLLLHDRGVLSVDDPIAVHWPEFAAAGKDDVSVRHALTHLAGLHEFRPPLEHETMFDWDECCSLLAAQPPIRPPGEAFAYHAFTQGFLLGEVVRRVTGQTMG